MAESGIGKPGEPNRAGRTRKVAGFFPAYKPPESESENGPESHPRVGHQIAERKKGREGTDGNAVGVLTVITGIRILIMLASIWSVKELAENPLTDRYADQDVRLIFGSIFAGAACLTGVQASRGIKRIFGKK